MVQVKGIKKSVFKDDRLRKILILIFMTGLTAGQKSFSQGSFDYSNMRFESLTTLNGLSSNQVTCILQDSKGYLWFGTTNGLNRYDGSGFKIWRHIPYDSTSLPSNYISKIFEDPLHQLWVNTSTGLAMLNRSTGKFKNFYENPDDKYTVPSKGITGIISDKMGHLWMSCQSANTLLIKYDIKSRIFKGYKLPADLEKKLKHSSAFHINNYAYSIEIDSDGIIFLTGFAGVILFDPADDRFSFIPSGNKLSMRVEQKVFKDSNNKIWLTHDSLGLAEIDQSGEHGSVFYPGEKFKIGDLYSCIQSISDSELWMGTKTSGIVVFNKKSHSFSFINHVDRPYSIPARTAISSCYKDNSDIIWIGSGNGVFKADTHCNLFITFPPLRKNSSEDDASFMGGQVLKDYKTGILYISNSSGDGVYAYNPATQESKAYHPGSLKGIQNRIDNMIRLHTGEFLILFIDTFYLFNPYNQKFTLFPYKLPFIIKDNIYSIFEDSKNNIWIGSYNNGAYVINPANKYFKYFPKDSQNMYAFPDEGAGMECEDKWGRIWFVSASGFGYYDPVKGVFHKPSFPSDFPKGEDSFREVCADKTGNVWIADFKKCLIRYRVEDNSFRYYDLNNGLPDLLLRQMVMDENNNLWIQTNSSVYRYDPFKEKYYSYSAADGIYSGSSVFSISIDTNNQLYISFRNDRICTANVNLLQENHLLPVVVINSIKVFDKEIPMTSDGVNLNHNENRLTFEFASLSYLHPEKNKFAYQLKDLDKNWTYCDSRNFATYNDIPPGIYTFTVKASNNDGVWNESGTSLKLTISPAWWQTIWFKIVALVCLGFIFFTIIRSFINRKLEKQRTEFEKQQRVLKERTRIASELHDDLGSGLTKISLMSQVAGNISGSKQQQTLEKITRESSDLVDKMNGIIWALNTKNDTLPNLVSFIRKKVFDMFEDSAIKLQWDSTANIPDMPITGEARRNIYLVVNEALHNALKYSNASMVTINSVVTQHDITIIIHDNGKGFVFNPTEMSDSYRKLKQEPDQEGLKTGSGNGLINMKNRMYEIGGTINISSGPGKGTEIRLKYNF